MLACTSAIIYAQLSHLEVVIVKMIISRVSFPFCIITTTKMLPFILYVTGIVYDTILRVVIIIDNCVIHYCLFSVNFIELLR